MSRVSKLAAAKLSGKLKVWVAVGTLDGTGKFVVHTRSRAVLAKVENAHDGWHAEVIQAPAKMPKKFLDTVATHLAMSATGVWWHQKLQVARSPRFPNVEISVRTPLAPLLGFAE